MGSWGSRLSAIDHRIWIGAGAALVLLIAVGVVVFSSATITLMVAAQKLQADVQMQGAATNYDINIPQGAFPTQAVSVMASGNLSGPATGHQQVAPLPATGEVVFQATGCSQPIIINAGEPLATTDGKQFQTTRAIQLLAPACSQNVQVAAVVGGVAGNLPLNTITVMVDPIPGVTVINPAPTAGGAEARLATVIQQSDVDAARRQLIPQVDTQARANLTALVARLHLIASSNPELTSQLDQAVGSESPTFNLSLTETLKGVAFSDTDIHQRLRTALRARVPLGYTLTGDPIRTWFDVTAANEDGSVTLSGHGLGYTLPVLDRAAVARAIALKTRGSATAQLRALPEVVAVRIDESPLPLPFLPPISSRISITILETSTVSGA